MIVMNYIPEDIVEKTHICYYTKFGVDGKIELWEMLEYTIKHPEAPEHAFVKKYENELVKSINQNDNSASNAHIHLMKHAQNNCLSSLQSD